MRQSYGHGQAIVMTALHNKRHSKAKARRKVMQALAMQVKSLLDLTYLADAPRSILQSKAVYRQLLSFAC